MFHGNTPGTTGSLLQDRGIKKLRFFYVILMVPRAASRLVRSQHAGTYKKKAGLKNRATNPEFRRSESGLVRGWRDRNVHYNLQSFGILQVGFFSSSPVVLVL